MKHPLMNRNAKHYDTGEKPTIWNIEQKLTVREMIGACKFMMIKYGERDKGQDEHDAEKMKDYLRYMEFLSGVLRDDPAIEYMTVQEAYDYLDVELEYHT